MASTVTLEPVRRGGDTTIDGMLRAFWEQTWPEGASNARLALVTFETRVTRQGRDQVDARVQPEVYLVPSDLSTQSIFCIGSVQKVFTGTMLAARILDPKMKGYSPDALAKAWLPDEVARAGPNKKISRTTLGQLATHSSCLKRSVKGENYGLYNGEGAPDEAEIRAWLDDDHWIPHCEAGTKSSYSNWGSVTLGFAVARPDDYHYDTTLGRYILPSFGMTARFTNTRDSTVCVPGYGPDGTTEKQGKARGIRSSIDDMTSFLGHYLYYAIGRFYGALSGPELFPAEVVAKAMTHPVPAVKNVAFDWFIRTLHDGERQYTVYDKNGETNLQGFSSYAAFSTFPAMLPDLNPLSQVGVLVLTNKAMAGIKPKPTALGLQVLKHLLGFANTASHSEGDDELDSDD